MASLSLLRLCTRTSSPVLSRVRASPPAAVTGSLASRYVPTLPSRSSFSTTIVPRSDEHGEESFEEFTARYEKEFDGVQDVFELQRNLNNAFAYDLVPATSVCVAALKAARRVNDFPTAVRIFEGIRAKVENRGQYHEYLRELKDLREEMGVELKEDLYPEQA